jgi:Zn-dependent protease with chaperone function
MNRKIAYKRSFAALLLAAVWLSPLALIGQQTRIVMPKNKYKVQDDIKLGNDAARQVEQQFPIIRDQDAAAYVERVGQRLVAAIPRDFSQPAFNYRFEWVNASDINAFALPGGPMFVNRGMLEAARNEGEMAGVMAHEISHVALRHATAQATKQSSAKNTLGTIGLILGGAILGGQAGAQLGALGAAAWMTKYSREYESQADALGARIMADAGYDPRDLANIFQTIQQQSGGRGGPQWLSDHPDPGNRYNAINREAQYLNVSKNPIKLTGDFERIKARFRSMPRARTMSQIQQGAPSGQNNGYPNRDSYPNGNSYPSEGVPGSNGRYSSSVPYPSTRVRAYTGVSWLRVNVPENWIDMSGQDSVEFAPQGAYGDQGITRGLMLGVFQSQNGDLENMSEDYLNGVLQSNSYLRQRGSFVQTTLGGRQAYTATASGLSPVTGRAEVVTVYTTRLRNGSVFYAVTVVPQDESYRYGGTFRNILNSIQLYDR